MKSIKNIVEFIGEHLTVEDAYCRVSKVSLFDTYRKWCEAKGCEFSPDRKPFDSIIRNELGARDSTNDGPRWQGEWVGIRYRGRTRVNTAATIPEIEVDLNAEIQYAGATKHLKRIEALERDSAYRFAHENLKNGRDTKPFGSVELYDLYTHWCFTQEIIAIDSLRKFRRVIEAVACVKRVRIGPKKIRGWSGLKEKSSNKLLNLILSVRTKNTPMPKRRCRDRI